MSMLHLLLLCFPLLAQEPIPDGVQRLADGSTVEVVVEGGDKPYILPGTYWVLPDTYYRAAVVKAKQLELYKTSLDECTTTSLAWQTRTSDVMRQCSEQFDHSDQTEANLVSQIKDWETRALVAEGRSKDLRNQRNTAWAITGGLVLGAVTVTAIAVAP